MFRFSQRSLKNLQGVHPDLVRVMHRALELTEVDFTVIEGVRSIERQRVMVATGKSKTMKSYHLIHSDGFGHAVDLYPYVPGVSADDRWDIKYYREINIAVQAAASEIGVTVTWGGTWKTFCDSPHFQIEV